MFNTGVSRMKDADRKVSVYFQAEFLKHGVLILRRPPRVEWWLFVENVNF